MFPSPALGCLARADQQEKHSGSYQHRNQNTDLRLLRLKEREVDMRGAENDEPEMSARRRLLVKENGWIARDDLKSNIQVL
jgi:hypothetical protein